MMRVMAGETKSIEMKQGLDVVEQLKEENRKLREENEMLFRIMVQMKGTMNRLLKRYVTEESKR